MTKGVIGREYEQKLIRNYYDSDKAELVAIYGRRRVGKTFLIKKMLGDEFAFSFTGMYNTPRSKQLGEFKRTLERYSGHVYNCPMDWFEAFQMLKEYLESLSRKKIVVFLDELPWMDTPKGNFLGAFGEFWNDWGSIKENFKLYVCGSATTWMVSKFIGDKGGLYGRVCRPIHLAPFTLHETEQFLWEIKEMELSRKQILDIYMIFGGIPYYLEMLVKGVPVNECVDDLFFREGAPLKEEYDFLFRSLFKDSGIYKRVIETLADKMKGMSRQELLETLKLPEGGNLTEVLDNLLKCDFIRKYTHIGKSGRDAQYQLIDCFSLFNLRFVSGNSGQDERFWSNMDGRGARNSWCGYAFEIVCLHHLKQIKESLGISGVLSNAYSWASKPFADEQGVEWKGGQIDLLIDRADNIISICEMKYVSDTYVITPEYEEKLRNRMSLFRKITKTKKALQMVFVTTYGIANNAYSHIAQNNLTIENLFV